MLGHRLWKQTTAAAELALAEIKSEHLELELVRSRASGAQEVISTLWAKLKRFCCQRVSWRTGAPTRLVSETDRMRPTTRTVR